MKSVLRTHWFGFLFLIPFLIMLAVHPYLGLSDALMAQAAPGEREAYFYNLLMVKVFYGGVTAFFVHTIAFAPRNQTWVILAKLAALGVYWIAILKFL